MRLQADRLSREPDLIFVADRHRARIGEKHVEGAADLAVEVVSDDSVTRDRIEKYGEHQAAGIPEYWLLDPRPGRQRSAFFQLVNGSYRAVEPDHDGRYRSVVLPGFWLRPEWLARDPLPDPLACLGEMVPEFRADAAAGQRGGGYRVRRDPGRGGADQQRPRQRPALVSAPRGRGADAPDAGPSRSASAGRIGSPPSPRSHPTRSSPWPRRPSPPRRPRTLASS